MPKYTVQSPEGKKITFQWDKPTPPTDADFAEVFRAASPQQSAPQTVPQPGVKESLFPRTADAAENGRSYPRQALAAGADFLSLPGRAIASAADRDRSYQESLRDTKGGNFASQVLRDPGLTAGLIAAPFTGGVSMGQGLAGLAARSAISGGAQALASAATHQGENLGAGRDVSLKDAATEVGLGAALPAAFTGAGGLLSGPLKNKALKVIDKAVPRKGGDEVPRPRNFKDVLDKGLVSYFGGAEASAKKMTGEVSRLGGLRDKAAQKADAVGNVVRVFEGTGSSVKQRLSAASRGNVAAVNGTSPLTNAFASTEKSLADEFADPKGKLSLENFEKAKEGLNYWKSQIAARPSFNKKTGEMSVSDAVAMRGIIDGQINFLRKTNALNDGFNKASKLLRSQLNDYIASASKKTGDITSEMGKVLPAQKDVLRMAGHKGGPSLWEVAALGAGGTIGGVSGGGEGAGGSTLATLGLLGGRRLLTTPGGAALLYDAGKFLGPEGLGPKSNAAKQILRRGLVAGTGQTGRE